MKRSWLLALMLLVPSVSSACDFAYMPSSKLYESASAIFVGKVVESPWKLDRDGKISASARASVRFSVEKKFRGAIGNQATIPAVSSDCSFPFLEGETYLVHAYQRDGVLESGSPWRPLLLSDATEPLKYIEQALAGRAPGLLYGILSMRGPEQANVVVRLQGKGGNLQLKVRPGYYEIVAPPGEYSAWLERDGKAIAERKTVLLTQGKAVLQNLE